jgi:hypothetical protein
MERCESVIDVEGTLIQCELELNHIDAHVNEEKEAAWAND